MLLVYPPFYYDITRTHKLLLCNRYCMRIKFAIEIFASCFIRKICENYWSRTFCDIWYSVRSKGLTTISPAMLYIPSKAVLPSEMSNALRFFLNCLSLKYSQISRRLTVPTLCCVVLWLAVNVYTCIGELLKCMQYLLSRRLQADCFNLPNHLSPTLTSSIPSTPQFSRPLNLLTPSSIHIPIIRYPLTDS